jgi:hypothetical protein
VARRCTDRDRRGSCPIGHDAGSRQLRSRYQRHWIVRGRHAADLLASRCRCASRRGPVVCAELRLVYADSVGPGQQLSVTSVFSTNPSPANSQPFYGLGTGIPGSCFTACSGTDLPYLFGIGTPLLLEFASPVTSISIVEDENNYNGVYMEAFNASNQIAGNCGTDAEGPLPVGNYGCYSVLTNPPNLVNQEVETSISASGGISKILIGGYNNGVAISTIQFTARAPEIDPASAASGLTLLLGGLLVLSGRRTVRS